MRWLLLPALLAGSVLGFHHAGAESPPRGASLGRDRAQAEIAAPVAARRPVRHVQNGIERIDFYAWLRDENWREVVDDASRLAPEIRAYLEAENAYAQAELAPLSTLRRRLFDEMKGRMKQDETSVPLADGPYAYWQRFMPGAEHPQIMRARRDGGEELLIDGAALAAGKAYFKLNEHHHSPDHRHLAYAVDETGAEKFTLRIRDLASGHDLPDVIEDVADFAWASDSRTLFYVRLDPELRPRFVYRHTLGTDPGRDALVYEEPDPSFSVAVDRTRTGRFIVVSMDNPETSEVRLVDASRPESAPVLVAPRQPGLRYYVDDWGGELVIRANADGAEDFKIVTAPSAAPGRENWQDLVPHRQGRQILAAAAYADHLVRLEREEGLPRLVVRRRSDGVEHALAFEEAAYALSFTAGYEFDTHTLRLFYSSPATPKRTFDYDMETRRRVLRKEQEIPSGHDPSAYVVRRLFAPAPDGERVPITVLHRRDLKLDGTSPLFLEGYGAYGVAFQAEFDANVFSLVDRGFVYAVAHVRGGSEKGERWHRAGQRQAKPNSFTDFIATAEHLIRERYTAPGRIVARGDSAGGLLVGAVANMRPDLFLGIIARVPFVDALNTMLDESLPLTPGEFPEWGDPIRDPEAFRTIRSYAPYENVRAQPYPHMLVTAGLSDPRVTYWEPAKWVAKLRATKTNDSRVLLVTRMSAGHFGAGGRFEWLEEVALMHAFAVDIAGLGHTPAALR